MSPRWPLVMTFAIAACSFQPSLITDAASDGPKAVDATVDTSIDAPSPPCDALACGVVGGICVDGTCLIQRSSAFRVVCPAGMPCKVECEGNDACKSGVDCAQATTCDVTCAGASACKDDGVDCGEAAACKVVCGGASACQHGMGPSAAVECRASACEVTCVGSSACQDGVEVDSAGTCISHCCAGACADGVGSCVSDMICP